MGSDPADGFLKSHSRLVKNITANVNKSIKLNARPVLRKCHWLFLMGPLSGGVRLQHEPPA